MLPYPLDVPALGDGARQTQTDHVQEQARDPEQVHGVSDKRRGDDVVHEEGPVVGEEHAPGENATDGQTDSRSKAKGPLTCSRLHKGGLFQFLKVKRC